MRPKELVCDIAWSRLPLREGLAIRALSIRQPWSYCITNGTKRVENRTTRTHYRGLFLIHAGKKYENGFEDKIKAYSTKIDILKMRLSSRGGFVGIARLIDCVNVSLNDDGSRAGPDLDYISDKIAPDQRVWTVLPKVRKPVGPFVYILDDVRALHTFVPYSGKLGFFRVTGPAVNALEAQLSAQELSGLSSFDNSV